MCKKRDAILSDEIFFKECLDYIIPGMEKVKEAIDDDNYVVARKYFAEHVRESLKPEIFFTIPFEEAENVCKYPNETNKEAADRIAENILISCGIAHEFGKTVDWCVNPVEDEFREWTWQLNRHNDWKILANAYRQTEDEKYAKAFVRLFKSWIEQATCPGDEISGYATRSWRTIECAIRMGANWPYILHSFYKSKVFTDDIIIDWYKSVAEHGRRLYVQHAKVGNWLVMEMNALAHIGILYPQIKSGEHWLSYGIEKLKDELYRQVYPDGFQYELSTGYHNAVINNYQRLFNIARAYDVALPKEMFVVLERMTLINIDLMQPNGRLPNINDGSHGKVSRSLKPRLAMFPDNPQIKWAISEGTEGEKPDYTSIGLPYSGHCVMRTGWDKGDTWALFDGGPFGRAHQHEDKLSILFYTNGKLVLTEAGNYSYDGSEMRKYVLSTRGHNTIRVDGKGQNRRTGYEFNEEDIQKKAGMSYNLSDEIDYAEGSYDEGYGKEQAKLAKHTRSVYLVKKPKYNLKSFLIVVDRLESDKEREYESIWHFDTQDVSLAKETDGESVKATMEELSVLITPKPEQMNIICGQEEPEWQGFIAKSSIQGDYHPIPTIVTKKGAKDIRMVTVMVPNGEDVPLIDRIKASNDIEGTDITLYFRDGEVWEMDEKSMRDK